MAREALHLRKMMVAASEFSAGENFKINITETIVVGKSLE